MIDRKAFLADAQRLLKTLEADLLERSESAEVPDVGRTLRDEYAAAQAAERTAQSFTEWRSDAITQAAAAWVLSAVFVRFLEDNGLVHTPRLSGPGDRLKQARDQHELYFRQHPTHTDRDYLLALFDELTKHAATRDVFGPHNPVRDLPSWLSGDAAGELVRFFQRIDPNTGALVHDFTDPAWDTRFLGDLYQDLSESSRKKYALLQTPVFVEEFILDRTLDPALAEFGLARPGYESRLDATGRLDPADRFRMIDPACGSGHFLLGGFARLVDRWRRLEPGTRDSVLVQRALDSIHGVDVNPYAIAIARFRLLLAALRECGVTRLSQAPGFEIHLACGDSLLHGSPGGDQKTMGWALTDHVYQPEDREALERLLRPGSYHTVVANPPYITPKDRALNKAYRDRYTTCHLKYSLAVPFMERIISLTVDSGFTGQITANSFMKREFGRKLIEEFFPRVDLIQVIDTSGAYIPGCGTPTVILFARNRRPATSTLRTVMGIRGEPSPPNDSSRGLVWSAILVQVDQPGSQSDYISVCDSPRELFHLHPWSIGGGGAAELRKRIDQSQASVLSDVGETAVGLVTGEDDAYAAAAKDWLRRGINAKELAGFVEGDRVRDWQIHATATALFPHDWVSREARLSELGQRLLWPLKTNLSNRLWFGKTQLERGLSWFEYGLLSGPVIGTPFSIAFGEVATHNHFVLDRGGKVFKQTAPVIKLPREAIVDDHLSLLGILNSSTACFWMRQTCFPKGGHGIGRGIQDEAWEFRFAFNATNLKSFPVPSKKTSRFSTQLDEAARRLQAHAPDKFLHCSHLRASVSGTSIKDSLASCRQDRTLALEEMISCQEELDWESYKLYNLINEGLTHSKPPALALGQRAFEIVLARKLAAGELQTTWFERHGSTPITELPAEWPEDYRQLVERRIALIESDPNIRLIEQPEYKRRWNTEPWDSQLERALREWLLARLESYFDFDGRMNDEGKSTARLPIALISVGKLADLARQDAEFLQVGEIYRDDPAFDVSRLVAELVAAESVPLLPVLRYKPSGLLKRAEWEATWDLQRQEDAIDARTTLPKDHPEHLTEIDAQQLKARTVGKVPVPPKYDSKDFLDPAYWRLRGKLDVPKERWVSFPHAPGEDGSLMVAWAGYDHLQIARAVSAHYVDVQERLGGRDDPRLVPLLACLLELLPWLKQWHNAIDPEFGVPMGDYFEGFVQEEARNLGLTLEQIRAWRPPERARGRSRKRPS